METRARLQGSDTVGCLALRRDLVWELLSLLTTKTSETRESGPATIPGTKHPLGS